MLNPAEVPGKWAVEAKKPVILVVDDHPTEQMLMRLLIDRLGLSAHVVETGEQALEALSNGGAYALVFMDWKLSGNMDGLQCTQRIREAESDNGRRVPIVAVTARAMTGDREKCLAAGMDDYLSKPFTAEQFKAMVVRWLSGPAEPEGPPEPVLS